LFSFSRKTSKAASPSATVADFTPRVSRNVLNKDRISGSGSAIKIWSGSNSFDKELLDLLSSSLFDVLLYSFDKLESATDAAELYVLYLNQVISALLI
jgi:hypothetical protein